MKIDLLDEPELQFGDGRHIDIRYGMMNFKPFDYREDTAPSEIKLGIIGNHSAVEGVVSWLKQCQMGVAGKESKQPNLFPDFPGYGDDKPLTADLKYEAKLQRIIPDKDINKLKNISDVNEVVEASVRLYIAEMEYLIGKYHVDTVICALPFAILEIIHKVKSKQSKRNSYDLHDLLKARAMRLGVHTQLMLPSTYDKKSARKLKELGFPISRQDDATIAWNLYNAFYYKAKGTPWRLIKDDTDYSSCYIGISFYHSLDRDVVNTSIAQVFNERGDGVIVRGGPAKLSKLDKQPHLTDEDSSRLLKNALDTYRMEHRTLPARVVLHKTSNFNADESEGFKAALEDNNISMAEFITLRQTETRILRNGSYPPRRGTLLTLDDTYQVLYTRGSVDFYSTYPGNYIPKPLLIVSEYRERPSKAIAEEVLGLTKMNWNKTQFDGADPITLVASRNVGQILKYIDDNDPIQPRYSFYM